MEENTYSFDVAEHIKTNTPRSPHTRIDIAAYEPDSKICPLTCLKAYINKTKALCNNETKLFISYVRPIKLYLRTRFLGGLKSLLDFAVLILRCSRHIVLDQHEIMAKAGWRSVEIFHKYYNKPVIPGRSLASAILDQ